jgi:hypothetical protein
MRFEWNALRVGSAVRVHRNGGVLEPGTVAFVDVLHGSNGVGIRVVSDDGDSVSWPSRLAVHAAVGDTDDPGEPCGRCAAQREAQS